MSCAGPVFTRALAVLLIAAPAALGQDEMVPDDLLERYEELAERVAELEEDDEDEEYGDGLVFRSGEAAGSILIFGDVRGLYDSQSEGGHTDFNLSSVDVVANVGLGQDYRMLSETVIHADHVSLERLWAQYTIDDALYLKFGTEHTPLSKWNFEFHHGAFLETTVTRPILARFEGGGGILPMHRTGLEAGGRLFTSDGSVQWFAAIANGRGSSPTDKQRTSDANDSKSFDLGLDLYPDSSTRARFGAAISFDDIPPDAMSADPDRARNMSEFLVTANASGMVGPAFVRSEFAYIQHDGRATGAEYAHTTGYLQVELPGETWTPYLRTGYRDMEQGDPFYEPVNRDLDETSHILGIRRELTGNLAFKFELGQGRRDVRAGSTVSGESVTTAAFQLAWTF